MFEGPMEKRLYIRMPKSLFDAVHNAARQRYVSASDVAREAIARYLQNEGFNGVPTTAVLSDGDGSSSEEA
jgi:Arc/MetJ-type ribon-helix-helix transcriptional regulator